MREMGREKERPGRTPEVAAKGFLFPLGHRALRIKLTERRIHFPRGRGEIPRLPTSPNASRTVIPMC
jgi:hypothetical protein